MGNRIIYKGNSVGETIQATIMPTASVDHLGEIVQYVGPDTTTSPIYRKGKFYECKPYGTSGYRWLSVDLIRGVNHAMYSEAWGGTDSKSDLIDTLNAFNEDFIEAAQDCDINQNVALYSCYVDTPYEGMPTNTQIKAYYDSDAGWVYRGYSSSTADEFAIIPTGSPIADVTVVKLGSGDGTPHWSGTRAEYEAVKDTLEAGTYVSITDDYDDGLEVVDVVEDGNTNPVTSNAVYDAITDITPVDAVTDGNMKAVTSNAVYDAINTVTTGTINYTNINGDVTLKWIKSGRTVIYNIYAFNITTDEGSVTWNIDLPQEIRPIYTAEGMKAALAWSGKMAGEAYIDSGRTHITIGANGDSASASGQIIAFV